MFACKISMFIWRRCKRHISTTGHLLKGKESNTSDVRDKAALVTGGGSGIGLECCRKLLQCGARGVTIADCNNERGECALKQLAEEFGNDKAVFVNCDVKRSELIDWAFKTTINAFNRLDIVINNAGVLNDKVWENEIHTNVCGTMVGNLLGLQYMAAHCLGHGGIVINIGSTMGLAPFHGCPIYSMTQAAILGLTRALGSGCHYDRTKVKVMALAVGLTDTPLMTNASKNAINNRFSADFKKELDYHEWQNPECVADAMMEAIKDGEPGAIWIVECGSSPYKICCPCYRELKSDDDDTIAPCETACRRSSPRSKEECEDEEKGKDAKKDDCKKDDCKPTKKPRSYKCPSIIWHGKEPMDLQKPASPPGKAAKGKPPAKGKPAPPPKGKPPPAKGKPPPAKAKPPPAKAKPPPAKAAPPAKGKPAAKVKAPPQAKKKLENSKSPEKKAKSDKAKSTKSKSDKDSSKDCKEKEKKADSNACNVDIKFKHKEDKKKKKKKCKSDKMKIERSGECKKKSKGSKKKKGDAKKGAPPKKVEKKDAKPKGKPSEGDSTKSKSKSKKSKVDDDLSFEVGCENEKRRKKKRGKRKN